LSTRETSKKAGLTFPNFRQIHSSQGSWSPVM
jgi:hypothetical protein